MSVATASTRPTAVVGWRPWAMLVALCLCLYLPGIAAVPPIDRDESRFVQATRQMLEGGDLVRIRFQDEARNKKPAGIYWLQAASVALFSSSRSTALWPYRLPSFLGALMAVLLTYGFGRRLVGREAALAGAALIGTSLGLVVEAHLAKTDAVLLATVCAAQGALGEIYRRRGTGERTPAGLAALFWVAQGIGILVKGPITPLVSALTALALCLADRDWRWLGALRGGWGAPLAAVIVLPWLVAIELATRGGFLAEAVGHDMLGKVAAAQESHGAPPGYYLALAAVTFWPGSLFLGATALAGWRRRHETAVRFLLAWALPTWLLFELLPTKLPHYVLPVYPALALLAGMALIGPSAPRRHVLETVIAVLWALVSLALAAGLVAAPILFGDGFAWASLIPAAAILVLGLRLLRREPPTVATTALLAALVFAPSFQLLLPGLDRLWLSRGAATLIAREIPGRKLPVDAVGYSEPSLVFLLGTDTRLVPPETAARDLAEKRSAAALVSDRDGAAFQAALAAHGAAATVIGHVGGLDYSNGRRLTLRLYMPTKD